MKIEEIINYDQFELMTLINQLKDISQKSHEWLQRVLVDLKENILEINKCHHQLKLKSDSVLQNKLISLVDSLHHSLANNCVRMLEMTSTDKDHACVCEFFARVASMLMPAYTEYQTKTAPKGSSRPNTETLDDWEYHKVKFEQELLDTVDIKTGGLFSEALAEIRKLMSFELASHCPKSLSFCYAWPNSQNDYYQEEQHLQNFLRGFARHIKASGVPIVLLDVFSNENGNNLWNLAKQIAYSDRIIQVGTRSMKKGVQRSFSPKSREYSLIVSRLNYVRTFPKQAAWDQLKYISEPNFLMPLLYSGSFQESFPYCDPDYKITVKPVIGSLGGYYMHFKKWLDDIYRIAGNALINKVWDRFEANVASSDLLTSNEKMQLMNGMKKADVEKMLAMKKLQSTQPKPLAKIITQPTKLNDPFVAKSASLSNAPFRLLSHAASPMHSTDTHASAKNSAITILDEKIAAIKSKLKQLKHTDCETANGTLKAIENLLLIRSAIQNNELEAIIEPRQVCETLLEKEMRSCPAEGTIAGRARALIKECFEALEAKLDILSVDEAKLQYNQDRINIILKQYIEIQVSPLYLSIQSELKKLEHLATQEGSLDAPTVYIIRPEREHSSVHPEAWVFPFTSCIITLLRATGLNVITNEDCMPGANKLAFMHKARATDNTLLFCTPTLTAMIKSQKLSQNIAVIVSALMGHNEGIEVDQMRCLPIQLCGTEKQMPTFQIEDPFLKLWDCDSFFDLLKKILTKTYYRDQMNHDFEQFWCNLIDLIDQSASKDTEGTHLANILN